MEGTCVCYCCSDYLSKKFYSSCQRGGKHSYISLNFMPELQRGEISCQFLPPGGSMGPIYVYNFYFVTNHKIAKKSTNTKARERISTFWNPYNFSNFFGVCLTKFLMNKFLLNKISHRFLLTTMLFTG